MLLPPLSLLIVAAAGYSCLRVRPRAARILLAVSWSLFVLLSTPLVGGGLLSMLEEHTGDPLVQDADVIVVLGGGTYFLAPEYGGRDTVNSDTLERLRYAALLYRRSMKPLLVTGGTPRGNAVPEGEQMRSVLQDEWQIPVTWTEDIANDTMENARASYALLAPLGLRRVYLVTDAWHMPRARLAFERAGIAVIPASTNYTTRSRLSPLMFLPSSEGLLKSSIFFHEILGNLWYRFRLFLESRTG
jgi:uncharacterized SAM-binding protein YcdF (DUF218 family)